MSWGENLTFVSTVSTLSQTAISKTSSSFETETKLISRHEITASLEDFISISSKLLKNNGSIYIVHRPERLSDLFYLLRKYNLEPKKLRLVHSYNNSKPKLILVKATKNAKSFLNIEEPLTIYNKDGSYTDEIFKIYGILNLWKVEEYIYEERLYTRRFE